MFAKTFPIVFYHGQALSALVPSMWPAALNGRTYMIDTNNDRWRHASIPILKPQQDANLSFSENSLNPDILLRRGQDSWHGGAGQAFRDREGGSDIRYRSSKGLYPWKFYELSLLNDTDAKTSTSNSNLYLEVAGSRLYTTDNQTLKFTTDVTAGTPSFTTVTGTHATAINGIASDGKYVYAAQGAQGIYLTDTGVSTAAAWITGTVNGVIAYVKGRLMCSSGPDIYNVTTSTATAGPTALPAAHFTFPNDGFTWVGFAEGKGAIFAAGYVGDKSYIYRISIKTDGTGLDVPTVAGQLPDGEIIRGIGSYLGFVLLGTDKGVRFCQVDNDNFLNIGAAIGATASRCFEGQEKFVWFGWSNYDTVSTGLGRMDLRNFTEDTVTGARTPAYASDLMVTGQGAVINCVTFQDVRVFTVAGLGLYAEDTASLVSSGTLDTGEVGFGIPDTKIALYVDVRSEPLEGSYAVALNLDAEEWNTIGIQDTAESHASSFPIADGAGQHFELRLTLTRDAVVTAGPTITRWTLKATPGATDTPAEYLYAPFQLFETLRLPGGQEAKCDVAFEREALKDLRRQRNVVIYQEAESLYTVQIENFEWAPVNFNLDPQGNVLSANGVMLVQLKRIM